MDGGKVYAASEKGKVYSLDASTGDELWQYEADGEVYTPPIVVGGVVYISSKPRYGDRLGYMYALDAATGELLWRYEAGDSDFPLITEADGVVYVGSSDGSVSVLDASNGEILWRYEFGHVDPLFRDLAGDRRATYPVVVDGVVYVGSEDGGVYALDPRMSRPVVRQPTPEPEPTYPVGESAL